MLIPDHLLRQTRTPGDNEIAFCINGTSMLADFERDLAQELASALLLPPAIVEVPTVTPTPAYDFRLPMLDQEVYLFLLHVCDAFMGFTPAAEYPEWLTASPIYLETGTVLVTLSPDYRRFNDIPRDAVIGARMLSLAAGYLTTYLRALPANARWQFLFYPNHEFLLDRLMDGSVGAALVWEPALMRYLADHPDAPETHIVGGLPFAVAPTRFVLALRPNEDYLNALLTDAIAALVGDGTIERLALEHGLVGE